MNISEDYSEKYSWLEWFVQGILHSILPRFDSERVDILIREQQRDTPLPAKLREDYDVTFMSNSKWRTHVIAPVGIASKVTILYCHGGAYVANAVDLHFLAVSGVIDLVGDCTCIFPEYALVPSVNHDSMFSGIEELYRQIVFSRPQEKIVIMGDSAGGGMALILGQRLAAAKRRGDDIRQPDSLILLSPWLDVSMSDPESARLSAVDPILAVSGLKRAGEMLAAGPNSVAVTDPAVSPLFGSLGGLPPISVWTSTHDLLLPDSRRLRDRFKAEDVTSRFRYYEKKGQLHCFILFGSASRETIREVANAICQDCNLEELPPQSPSNYICF